MSTTIDGPLGPLLIPPERVYVVREALLAWLDMGNTGGKESLLATLALCDSWRPAEHDAYAVKALAPSLGLLFYLRVKGARAECGPTVTNVVQVRRLPACRDRVSYRRRAMGLNLRSRRSRE